MTFRLSALWGLSLLDGIFTVILSGMGAAEANPFTGWLYETSPWLLIVVKQLLVGVCCYGLWRLQKPTVATVCALVYFALVFYEIGLLGR